MLHRDKTAAKPLRYLCAVTDLPRPNYTTIFETLQLSLGETAEIDVGATIAPAPNDWRDTLRSSLPRLPLGADEGAQFRMTDVIGSGGMGVVHLAYQAALGRHVAIKTVHADKATRHAENALLQEARVMGIVEHPNVVPVHVIGQDGSGRPIIVMKRVEGIGWEQYLDGNEEPDTDDVLGFHLGVVVAICRALALAHDRNVLHRDIKPENVMIGTFGEVYLLDWGLAASTVPDVPFVPFVKEQVDVVGTPAYMAPEMTVRGGDVGVHTDVFLVGGALYHVATGSAPNSGSSLFDVLACAYEGRPRAYPDDVPPELREICERALAHQPRDRYASVDELRAAVQAFLSHRHSHVLTHQALAQVNKLEAVLQSDDGSEDLYELFGAARFGLSSALQIWPANREAIEGLQRCLSAMVEHELQEQNASAARALLSQLPESDADLERRVDELEKSVARRAAALEKIAYDYDPRVGLVVRRSLVGIVAALFFVAPPLMHLTADMGVPESLRWLTTDRLAFVSTAYGLTFLPIFLGFLWITIRELGDHKGSRVFAKSMLAMFIIGWTARSSTLWAHTPLHLATAAEAGIYASGLIVLGLGIDRRLFVPGVWFALSGVMSVALPAYTLEFFCWSAVCACLSFLVFDRLPRSLQGPQLDD